MGGRVSVSGSSFQFAQHYRILFRARIRGAHGRLNDKAAMEGMGLNPREVMDLAISAMSAMTFSWGFVHCDPHPGNILVRKHPTKKGKPQIVSRPPNRQSRELTTRS